MIPINYDAIISLICFFAGIYVFWRIGGFTTKQYTPALAGVMVSVGLIAWALLILLSLSAIFETPPWAFTKGWKGSWGYTASRFFMAMMWLLALKQVATYSPKCRHDVKAKL